MARKKKHEEHENHERWLVSYADFITLLFAFFVVMYSISSINEGKYRVLSSTLVTAFSHPAKTLDPIQYGTQLRAPIIQHKMMKKSDQENSVSRVGIDYQIMPSPGQMAQMEKISDKIQHSLKKLIDQGLVSVSKTNKGVEIAINAEILFSSGEAQLSNNAQQILHRIAGLLKPENNHINVEGYTDDVPISTRQFPSNWELSAARAASVVHLFTKEGIQPQRMAAIGFGEYRPVAPNATIEGRRKNRRVTIMVLNEPFEKKINLDKLEKQGDAANDISTGFKNSDTKAGQRSGVVVLPVATPSGNAADSGNRSTTTKPIVLGGDGSPSGRTDAQTGQKGTKKSIPLALPLDTSGGRPSVIQLPPTNVIPIR